MERPDERMRRRAQRPESGCVVGPKGPMSRYPIGPLAGRAPGALQDGRFIWQLVGVLDT